MITLGAHKHNVTAQLAKEGKLPPKPARMSKKEMERLLMSEVYSQIMKRLLLPKEDAK